LTHGAIVCTMKSMKKVLIIEDDIAMQELISKELGTAYEVKSVSEGTAAIAEASVFQPNVILLDINLLGSMDGVAILDLLRSDDFTSTIPVLVYTNSDSDRKQELLDHGANDYLTKAHTDVASIAAVIKKYAELPPIPVVKKAEGEE